MKIISFYNAKGGVGKTTSTASIGYILAQKGYRVLLIDLDPQGNLSMLMGLNSESATHTSVDIMMEGLDIRQAVYQTQYENLHIVPCNRNRIKEEHLHIGRFVNGEHTLMNALEDVAGDFDFVLIDCPPSLAEMTVNAVSASGHVFIPLKIDNFSFDGVKEMSKKVADIKLNYNENVELSGVFVTMDEKTTVNKQIKNALKEALGNTLMESCIRKTSKVIESTFYSMPVVVYDAKCTASQDYYAMTEEILSKTL